MTNWKYVVDLSGFWNSDISIEKKGKLVSREIRKTFPSNWFDLTDEDYNEELDDIAEAFENITGFDNVSPVEEFDGWMEELYNFGDQNKTAWIKTK